MCKASLEGWLACWADFLMGFDKNQLPLRKENIVADTLSCSMWNQELNKPDATTRFDMAVAKRLNLIFIQETSKNSSSGIT